MDNEIGIRIFALPGRDPDLALPGYATAGAAGMDLRACLGREDRAEGIALAPGARLLVPTGLAVEIPEGYEIQVRPRSGLALREGVTLVNSPGTIDCDYRGEIGVIVINHGNRPVTISHGMRIAQIVLAPVSRIRWERTDRLSVTERGTGGFGSTGTDAAEPRPWGGANPNALGGE